MTLHLHHLTGCAPTPLAFYLKALGILRIVARQKDEDARGFWQDEHFCLLTKLDRGGLERFFLEEYRPTPAFNPWGARSGFYRGSSESSARAALEKIEASTDQRLAEFREDIGRTRSSVAAVGGSKPDEDASKVALLSSMRNGLRGAASEWLSTVMAIVGGAFKPPAIVGTGGNEGSGSYLAAYFQSIVECLLSDDDMENRERLVRSLFAPRDGVQATPKHAWGGTFGQFMPEGNGSAWDFVLTLEGAMVFRSSVTHRSTTGASRFLSSPFYVPHEASGGSSDSTIDEYTLQKGRPNPGRGEQWFPLWHTPASYAEVEAIVGEARCSVGRRAAARPLDVARAVGRLGVARGLTSFLRYGYLQRNNQALHFAVPLGRVDVRARPQSRLLDEIDTWLHRLHRTARGKSAPARFVAAQRRVADSAMAACESSSPGSWQDLLIACSAIEAIQAGGTCFDAGPLPRISSGWIDAAGDDSPEWSLAVALGSAAAGYEKGRPIDTVRAHALPLAKGGRRFATNDKRLAKDPRVVLNGRYAISDLIALVERRLIEASQGGQRTLPLVAAPGAGARTEDLAAFLDGNVDADRVVRLARALMAVRWRGSVGRRPAAGVANRSPILDEAWQAMRLCGLPFEVAERRTPIDLAMFRRLASGDAAGATTIALARLKAVGFRAPLVAAMADVATSRRWAAALAFPIEPPVAEAMAEHFTNHVTLETP